MQSNQQDEIRPLHIVRDKHVEVTYATNTNEIAFVRVEDMSRGRRGVRQLGQEGDETALKYVITINTEKAALLYADTWQYGRVPLQTFLLGLQLHEVAHIRYEAFRYKPPVADGVFHVIHNILLDAQGEYALTAEFPTLVRYIRVINSALRKTTTLETKGQQVERTVKKEVADLNRRLSAFFSLCRFGVFQPKEESDRDFLTFCLPLVLSATRGTAKEVMEVTTAVYRYLTFDASTKMQSLMAQAEPETVAIGEGDLDQLTAGDMVIGTTIMDAVNEMKAGDYTASLGGPPLKEHDDDNPFYRETLEQYADYIQRLRRVFRTRLDTYSRVQAADGDFNFGKQQAAYVESFTLEQSTSYLYTKRNRPSLDIAIIRDVSYSTEPVKVSFARLTIALLAAIYGLDGIRIAEIDFSGEALLNLPFDMQIRQSMIRPLAVGGTEVCTAYTIASKLAWRQRNRICYVITDGEFADGDKVDSHEQQLKRMGIQIEKWHLSATRQNRSNGLNVTTFEDFPSAIAQSVLRRLV